MRIVAGRFRGRALAALGKGDPSAALRPTTDRVRESLFNILGGGRFGDPVTDARVLDLFAGTGALGLEALSRGAAHVSFVENGRKSLSVLSDNIRLLGVSGDTRMLRVDARKLPETSEACDLVFLDPPYSRNLGQAALARATEAGWIAPGALVVWEEAAEMPASHGYSKLDARRFGDSWMTFLLRDG